MGDYNTDVLKLLKERDEARRLAESYRDRFSMDRGHTYEATLVIMALPWEEAHVLAGTKPK